MPLPDADSPDKSRLYEELKSKTALPSATGAITPDLIDNLKNATFIDADNEDQLRRLVLLMQATGVGSMSGPIPGTQLIEKQTFTSAGFRTYLTPGVGEVWLYTGACVNGATGLSGTGTIEVDITDTTNSNRLIVQDFNFTSSADFPVVESGNVQPLYIDYGQRLTINAEGTFTTVIVTAGFIRVR
jgi:hypothetical protein